MRGDKELVGLLTEIEVDGAIICNLSKKSFGVQWAIRIDEQTTRSVKNGRKIHHLGQFDGHLCSSRIIRPMSPNYPGRRTSNLIFFRDEKETKTHQLS